MHSYTEILKPSVVSHGCILKCTGTLGEENEILIVVRGQSLLQVYSGLGSENFQWLTDLQLQGTALGIYPLNNNMLFISFAAAKLVLLEWDSAHLEFHSKSLHYYEKQQMVSASDSLGGLSHKLMVDVDKKTLSLWVQQELVTQTRFDTEKAGDIRAYIQPNNNVRKQNDSHTDINHWIKPISSVSSVQKLKNDLGISEIVDMGLLTCYIEPTLAILGWKDPDWAGTVGVHGRKTKEIIAVTFGSKVPVLKITDVEYDALQLIPLTKVSSRIALVIELHGIQVIGESGNLIPINLSLEGVSLEDCLVTQMDNTRFVTVLSKSGDLLVLDVYECLLIQKHEKWISSGPVSLHVSSNYIVAGSLEGNAKVASWRLMNDDSGYLNGIETIKSVEDNPNSICISSLNDIFSSAPKPRYKESPSITVVHELGNYGSLSAITTISAGIACATNSGILILEKELTLIDLGSITLGLQPGNFWLPSSSIPSRPILINNSKIYNKASSPSRKRLRTVDNHHNENESVIKTEFDELFQDSKTPLGLPRGIAVDQKTLAVFEDSVSVWVVQTQSISIFKKKSWRPLKRKAIEICDLAECCSSRIVTYSSEKKACRLYCSKKLELLREIDNIDSVAISETVLIASQGRNLNLVNLKENSVIVYDVSNLDKFSEPCDSNSDLNAFKTGEHCCNGKVYNSIYSLRFHGADYIGVHIDRYFTIYELRRTLLIKRFTMPFAVNQSPILLSEMEMLVFPGKKTHVLVKGSKSNFQYHRLGLYGDCLIDAVPLQGNSFAWLDDKDTLHLAEVDDSLNYHSFSLPVRQVSLPIKNCSVMGIGYHEESTSLIVGVNVESRAQDSSKPTQENIEEKLNIQEDAYNDSIHDYSNERYRLKENSGLEKARGAIYTLDLHSNEFYQEPLVKIDELLLSMCVIDYDDMNCRQLLSVGTSKVALESEETNGNLLIYKIQTVGSDNRGKKSESLLQLNIFASEQLRGPVSSISTSMGYLVVAHGQQIRVFNIHGHSKIDARGFFQTDIYVRDIKCIRNIIGLGEQMKPPRLINFGTKPHRLDQLSAADPCRTVTSAVEFVSSAVRGDLSLVCATENKILSIYQYDPENIESNGGSRLVPTSNFYTGKQCNAMCAAQVYNNNDIVAYGVNGDGSMFSVRPLNEELYRTLYILTNQLLQSLEGKAGLNPKMHRLFGTNMQSNNKSQLLDMEFANRFWDLSVQQQNSYGRILGFQGLRRAQRALSVESRDQIKL